MAALFREKTSLEERKRETAEIMRQFPNKVPVYLTKHEGSELPDLSKNKFLVPRSNSVIGFLGGLRKKMKLEKDQALFVFTEGLTSLSGDALISELYEREKHEDGFLYMVFREQETTGAL